MMHTYHHLRAAIGHSHSSFRLGSNLPPQITKHCVLASAVLYLILCAQKKIFVLPGFSCTQKPLCARPWGNFRAEPVLVALTFYDFSEP